MGSDADVLTGRQGESFVFHYLKYKHPDAEVKWVNRTDETGRPYDIYMKLVNEQEHFIEVKTTRAANQHTFPVSIGEVEFLLKHPWNYYIYRVYHTENAESSTITIINKVEDNLKNKHLKLCMSLVSKQTD